MKPVRFLFPLSTFLLRIGVVFYTYITYFHHVLNFRVNEIDFYFSALLNIFAVLLLIGTFTKKHSLTVLSGLVLFILGLIKVITYSGDVSTTGFIATLFFTLIALFFLGNGNKSR